MSNLLDLNEVLSHSQSVRMRIVDSLTKDGIPSAKEDIEILNKTLDSLDKAVVAKKRLSIDENSSTNEKEASLLLTQILKQFISPELTKVHTNKQTEISINIDERSIVPDEMHIGLQDISLDSIIGQ